MRCSQRLLNKKGVKNVMSLVGRGLKPKIASPDPQEQDDAKAIAKTQDSPERKHKRDGEDSADRRGKTMTFCKAVTPKEDKIIWDIFKFSPK